MAKDPVCGMYVDEKTAEYIFVKKGKGIILAARIAIRNLLKIKGD